MSRPGNAATTPVIPGFYPDPTICRVGADYFLAHSSFEYFPGAPIFHSTDLVSWRQVGNILTSRAQFVEGESRPSTGVYGSTLRHHARRFYLITTNMSDYESGQVIVTAEDPTGPWSAPVWVKEARGIDPDLCWDDAGRCLLTWHYLDLTTGEQDIRQAPIDPATGAFLAPAYPVWQGSGLPAAEGPHLYRIGGWWYLLLAEGGTERGHCVTVARSRRPDGPFEGCPDNPIFTRRSSIEPVQNVGHADLVEAPDGGWAAVYLGVRPAGSTPGFHVLGRETFLAGIDWVDEWPAFVADRFDVPAADHSFTDDFASAELDFRWVVPAGDLTTVGLDPTRGAVVRDGTLLCTRVRDLRWRAEAVVEGSGALQVRIDARHFYGLTLEDGTVRAVARIGGVDATVGAIEIGPLATLTLESVDPATAPVPMGEAGPDDIVLSVTGEGGDTIPLARLDGRYLSTEVASGFTGRVIALGGADVPTVARSFAYRAT